MQIEPGQIAVVTGAATGIGRSLALRLAANGVHLSLCDVDQAMLARTADECRAAAPPGTRVHAQHADVADERQVLAFRDASVAAHVTDCVQLLFNNAGIGGGGSFVDGDRGTWERTFAVCWWGVYYNARAFLPLLVASRQACMVNVSSVNGFWASLGPAQTVTAYAAAKFAVKGFTEALITDLRLNAPHVGCAVVMPGHIGTEIAAKSLAAQTWTPRLIASARRQLVHEGNPAADALDDAGVIAAIGARVAQFRENALMTPDAAAAVILEGVNAGRWRILVGDDAHWLDHNVRERPENAYDIAFVQALVAANEARTADAR